jgi:metal-responsive CopG/Arc/MetJ family transcriptional regulator
MKFCISVPDSLHEEVETKRGYIPRSVFVQNALREYVKTHDYGIKESVRGQVYQDHSPITDPEISSEENPYD